MTDVEKGPGKHGTSARFALAKSDLGLTCTSGQGVTEATKAAKIRTRENSTQFVRSPRVGKSAGIAEKDAAETARQKAEISESA